jgi:PAS domain S-box-containing protein
MDNFPLTPSLTPEIFQSLVEHVNAVFWVRSADGKEQLYVSPFFEKVWGVSLDELIINQTAFIDTVHEEDKSKVLRAFEKLASNGLAENYNLTYKIIRADGELRLIHDRGFSISDENGELLYKAGFAEDITDQKDIEQKLILGEEKYRLAIEATRDGIWDWDIDSGIVEYTNSWLKILDISKVSNELSLWESRIHPDDKPTVMDSLQKHLEGKNSNWTKEHRLKIGNNQWKWVLGRGEVIKRDENGRPLRMIGTMTDISRQKQLEYQLETEKNLLEKKVSARTAELLLAKESAETANKEKSRFLANMSHELRTPMHAIHSFTKLALKRNLDEKAHHFLENIDVSTTRLTNLLNDLLDLSKLESGKMELNPNANDIANIIHYVVESLEGLLKDKNLLLDLSDVTNITIQVDSLLITQVITNLMSNAIKFSPQGGVIKLTSKIINDYVQIIVDDEGVGVPKGEQEMIFDSFVQSTKTVKKSGGTGLGLPICKEIIDLHKGEIWVESPPEGKTKGSRFIVNLPNNTN